MKTYILTEKEIREIVAESYVRGIHDEHHSIDFSKLKESQPSISAEDFLKEKGIDFGKHGIIETKKGIVDLLTEFASRQGKEVEISETTHRNLCTCKHLVESYHNFCPNCGSKIVWK